MRTDRRNRCDQIIDLIDRCLAEREATRPIDATSQTFHPKDET